MARREFLQLAKKFVLGKHDPSGMYISEKLDGMRVFWDGGVTRGLPTDTVPWANIIDPKTGDRKKKIKPVATGLWSRYGNPIIAPDWWLNQLPAMFLDGELFAGRGNFQTLMSISKKDVADEDAWREVEFAVFGAPSLTSVFQPGEIKNPNFHRDIRIAVCGSFVRSNMDRVAGIDSLEGGTLSFEEEINLLQASLLGGDLCYLHPHVRLPDDRMKAEEHMGRFMDTVLDQGGEGVMLRDPSSVWTPKRVNSLLKLKPFTDDQGTVTGYVSGRQTDKGSKLRGLIGALILDYSGNRLELSGLTNEERKFATKHDEQWAYDRPGEDMPAWVEGAYFKVGDTVEFRYRELSDDGIPKEARYLRRTS